jgi:hypothetical protein
MVQHYMVAGPQEAKWIFKHEIAYEGIHKDSELRVLKK